MSDVQPHRCATPELGTATQPIRYVPWTCGECGRMWTVQDTGALRRWVEIRGPLLVDGSMLRRENAELVALLREARGYVGSANTHLFSDPRMRLLERIEAVLARYPEPEVTR